jgi:hypothetical protein
MATRFWVGGTGTWDNADTTHWAATTGGAGGASVPVSTDTVTFDGSSGGGTVTVNHATLNIQTLTLTAFTGTVDFATNNNNITISGTGGNVLVRTGSATNTLNMGNGTWTLSAAGTIINFGSATNFTLNSNSSTVSVTNTSATTKNIVLATGLTLNAVSIVAGTLSTLGIINLQGPGTISTLTVAAPNIIGIANGTTVTITNGMTITGTSTNQITFCCSTLGGGGTISSANASSYTWCAFRDLAFAGGGNQTATNSFNLGRNSISGGGTLSITAPTSGGGGQLIFGG